MASGLVEFQQSIMQSLQRLAEKPHSPSHQTTDGELVFINATSQDMDLAHQVEGMLSQQGLECNLPLETSRPLSAARKSVYRESTPRIVPLNLCLSKIKRMNRIFHIT